VEVTQPAAALEFSSAWSEPPMPGMPDPELPADEEPRGHPEQLDDDAPPEAYDPAAPFGRFANGKPRKGPAGYRKAGKPKARRAPSPPRKTTAPTRARTKTPAGPDYRQLSLSLVQGAEALAGMAGAVTRNPTIALHAMTLVVHEEALVKVSAEMALSEVWWAQQLERMATGSKWSGPAMAGLALLLQFGVNQGVLPAGVLGTKTPDQIRAKAAEILAEREAIAQAMMGQAA
jgi:hypothetical protein